MTDQEQVLVHLARPGSQDPTWLASREMALREVLRIVSQQRVSMLWNDASYNQTVATVEPRLPADGIDLVVTCYMRGWLAPIDEMSTEGLIDWFPSDQEKYGSVLRVFLGPDSRPKAWRLTDAGWSVLEENHALLVQTVRLTEWILGFTIILLVLALLEFLKPLLDVLR